MAGAATEGRDGACDVQDVVIDASTLVEVEAGSTRFDRRKFVVVSASKVTQWKMPSGSEGLEAEADYLFNELDVYLGRQLGLLNAVTEGGISDAEHHEDPSRMGFADPSHYVPLVVKAVDRLEETDARLLERFGGTGDFHFHEQCHPRAYPTYMGIGGVNTEGEKFQPLPLENGTYEHAVEYLHNVWMNYFGRNKFLWPRYFEPLNEPAMCLLQDDGLAEFHLAVRRAFHDRGITDKQTLIGGPAFNQPSFYRESFTRPMWTLVRRFWEVTMQELDFYSFHIFENIGQTSQAGPGHQLDVVLDLCEAVVANIAGEIKPLVVSAYGQGPGDDKFVSNMEKRRRVHFYHVWSLTKITMYLARRAYGVAKAVPHLNAGRGAGNFAYYAQLYHYEGFTKKGKISRSDLMRFFELWRDVRGDYVDIRNDERHPDVQLLALRDDSSPSGSTLRVLVVNLSDLDAVSVPLYVAPAFTGHPKLRRLFLCEGRAALEDIELASSVAVDGRIDVRLRPAEMHLYSIPLPGAATGSKTLRMMRFHGKSTEIDIHHDRPASTRLKVPEWVVQRATRAEFRIGFARPGNLQSYPVDVRINDEHFSWVQGLDQVPGRQRDQWVRSAKFSVSPDKLRKNNEIAITFADSGGKLAAVTATVLIDKSHGSKIDSAQTSVGAQIEGQKDEL